MNKYQIISIAGVLALFAGAACADPLASEQGLRKAIHENIERTHAATAGKYDRVLSLAGDRRRELAAQKDAVARSYSEWHRLNAAVNDSKTPDAAQFRVLEAAAQNYARVSRMFMELQTRNSGQEKLRTREHRLRRCDQCAECRGTGRRGEKTRQNGQAQTSQASAVSTRGQGPDAVVAHANLGTHPVERLGSILRNGFGFHPQNFRLPITGSPAGKSC